MSHGPILPILIPLGAAVLCLLADRAGTGVQRAIAGIAMAALASASIVLLVSAGDDTIAVYAPGAWPAPYGIVLVVDRMSAMMVVLVAALAIPVLIRATAGVDRAGRHFHALFQLQIAGLNGAFLTGDLFNLFVFFEVLLLASYALLLHGGGRMRTEAGLAYVVLNLAGSALFLVALALLYGTLGTLNLADMALVLPDVAPADQALVRTAAMLLIAVFLLKGALLPVSFWLPRVYAAATAPVAALFAIMTKVGVYATLRVSTIGFPAAPFMADLVDPWLPVLAIATIAAGAIGALGAQRFAVIVANLVLVSTGMLLAAVAARSPAATAAVLYYLPHTTLITAGLFLLGDTIAGHRADTADTLTKGPPLAYASLLGGAYLILALAVSGLPPLSGFIGKVMLMQALRETAFAPATWLAFLVSGLIVALVLARAASVLFWEPGPVKSAPRQPEPGARRTQLALTLLVVASPALTIAAAPVAGYAQAAAAQLHARTPYVSAVLGTQPDIARERRP
jgi:multicomponent K+:H+ antiporter subunit D